MKKSLIISLMVVALVCVFALPAVIAANAARSEERRVGKECRL